MSGSGVNEESTPGLFRYRWVVIRRMVGKQAVRICERHVRVRCNCIANADITHI